MAEPQELIDYDRWKVRKFGLYYHDGPGGQPTGFAPMAWDQVEPSTEFRGNWHLGEMGNHLEATSNGLITRLVINVPPGTMKSLMTCTFWPAHTWIEQPHKKWIFMSNSPTLSARDAERTLDLISSEWFKARWPHVYPLDRAIGKYKINGGGWRLSGSTHGQVIGWHPNIQVVDDPMQAKDAQGNAAVAKTELEFVKNWWDGTMSTRGDQKTLARVIIMQRLHEDDLAGYCLSKSADKYVHLCFPMRFEERRRCLTNWGGDLRTIEGQLLWEERFSEKEVKRSEAELNNEADAQLQQRPGRAGGQIFRLSWLKFWTELPQFEEIALSWDMTFKDTMGADFVCGQVWGRWGGAYYLIDRVYDRMNFPQTVMSFEAQCRDYPNAIAKLVEDKANGPAVIATLSSKISGMIPRTPLGSKVGRANAVSHLHRAGNVYYPHPDLPSKSWVREHVKDMLGFPLRKHDDTVDAETQMLAYWSESYNNLLETIGRMRAAGISVV